MKKNCAIINFNIRTKDLRENHHTDFKAKELVDYFFSYFEKKHGPIGTIDFLWLSNTEESNESNSVDMQYPSDNYIKYKKAKAEILSQLISRHIPPEQREQTAMIQAAFETWTGIHIAQKYNFPIVNVCEMYDKGELVNVSGEYVKEGISSGRKINVGE